MNKPNTNQTCIPPNSKESKVDDSSKQKNKSLANLSNKSTCHQTVTKNSTFSGDEKQFNASQAETKPSATSQVITSIAEVESPEKKKSSKFISSNLTSSKKSKKF